MLLSDMKKVSGLRSSRSSFYSSRGTGPGSVCGTRSQNGNGFFTINFNKFPNIKGEFSSVPQRHKDHVWTLWTSDTKITGRTWT